MPLTTARLSRANTVVALVIVLVVLANVVYALWPESPRVHVTAYFPRAVGLYEGSEVRVLGVRIGTVDKVMPVGRSVRVDLSYDAEYKVPADARAAVLAPSVVSDRYVQLAPAYRDGPVLKDGAKIPRERTAVPVELDRIYESVNDLAVALGPEGANQSGALSRLLGVGARNLEGQGEKLGATVGDVADAVETVSAGREDLFATVRQLQDFSSTLAAADADVRKFNADLAEVADQLAGERDDLSAALDNLAVALTEVSTFVRDNRKQLRGNVKGLTRLSKILVRQQDALREVLDAAPVALTNLDRSYNPVSGTLDTRNNFAHLDDPDLYLCSLLLEVGQPERVCGLLSGVFDQLPDLPELPPGNSARRPVGPDLGDSAGRDLTLGGILGERP